MTVNFEKTSKFLLMATVSEVDSRQVTSRQHSFSYRGKSIAVACAKLVC